MADAQDLCEAEGGMLPEPRNREEHDFLNSFTTVQFYLGATDKAKEGHWAWNSDGSSVQWALWGTDEPNGGSDQNCLLMLKKGAGFKDRWATGWCSCSSCSRTVVCERKGKFSNYHPS